MRSKNLGEYGEELAVKHLQKNKYTVLDRNYRWQKIEIDIIAIKNGQLIACEVKTRSSMKIGQPYRAVNQKKQQRIIRAINHYLESKKWNIDVQFDVLSIIHNRNCTEVDHISNAFVPMLQVA